jgi:hypothetical protein
MTACRLRFSWSSWKSSLKRSGSEVDFRSPHTITCFASPLDLYRARAYTDWRPIISTSLLDCMGTKTMAKNMMAMMAKRPSSESGEMSPYPTVVIVTVIT